MERELEKLERQGLRRSCRRIEQVEGGRIRVDGRWLVHLGSNNYLGLSLHPEVVAAAQEAARKWGAGSGSARLIGGSFAVHGELEEELARFKQAEAALLFSTGYMANLGVIPALVGRGDLVVCDRLAHASLVDGCRLSGADLRVYPHADAGRLDAALRRRRDRYRRLLVVTEGVFSMDGDIAPLPEILEVVRRHDGWLLLDDAHGTGVLGESGRGTLEHFGIGPEGILQMGTLSKALGSLGGYVAGPRAVVETLVNRARSFIYTTAPSPADAAAALAALRVIRREPGLRRRLWESVRRWREGLRRIGWPLLAGESPIVPVRTGSVHRTMEAARALLERGVYAPGIRPPTVPAGSARIRTSVTALHTEEEMDAALRAFEAVLGAAAPGAVSVEGR
ncbi:MAG: 8-amino-7-oxononanoate synthase [Candidatus Omnitrophica bacterium]|nr:8-amino-7-oxononanoate synthase [Candidatus Omnitrophota bacterium]